MERVKYIDRRKCRMLNTGKLYRRYYLEFLWIFVVLIYMLQYNLVDDLNVVWLVRK